MFCYSCCKLFFVLKIKRTTKTIKAHIWLPNLFVMKKHGEGRKHKGLVWLGKHVCSLYKNSFKKI